MIYNTITLGSSTLYRPNEFTPAREYVYAGEITTCTGKIIADRIGWRYADITLNWGSLPQDQLDALLALNGQETTITFTDVDGTTVTEAVIPSTHSMTATRALRFGSPVWRDIQTELRFINVHH